MTEAHATEAPADDTPVSDDTPADDTPASDDTPVSGAATVALLSDEILPAAEELLIAPEEPTPSEPTAPSEDSDADLAEDAATVES